MPKGNTIVIEISKDRRITCDSMQFMVEYRHKKKTKAGEPAQYGWASRLFFSRISSLLRWLKNERIRSIDASTLEDLLKAHQKAHREIMGISRKMYKAIQENRSVAADLFSEKGS